MPKISVFDKTGKEVSTMELSDAVFGVTPNKEVMHMAVVNYLSLIHIYLWNVYCHYCAAGEKISSGA